MTEACPVCGEPYTHKVTETPNTNKSLREDYARCRSQQSETKITMYVHKPEPTVTRLRRSRDGDEQRGVLARLFR